MNQFHERGTRTRRGAMLAAVILGGASALPVSDAAALTVNWETVVNNAFAVPGGTTEQFFSYNPPSLSDGRVVAFRARARDAGGGGGGTGEPFRGVYTRDMSVPGAPVQTVADNKTVLVPAPNNLGTIFTEFPSFPRMDKAGTVAFRGQSAPVYEYVVDPVTGDTTRAGTSGTFTTGPGPLTTGSTQLGAVPGLEHFQVPGSAAAGTKFDQFPGAPTPDGTIVAFKGNWTDGTGTGRTGIYFRDVTAAGGTDPVRFIAESGMAIPDGGGTGGSPVFGSTAPPSAAAGKVVFTGFDNEAAPTAGGIYMAQIAENAPLSALVDFSTPVPGNPGQSFNRFGEALSFDGRRVGFWGAWGSETKTVTLTCPTDGNAARNAVCVEQSDRDPVSGEPTGQTTREVPVNQGIFVVDTQTGAVEKVAQTGEQGIEDLLFWNFSGRAPGAGFPGDTGEDDAEPPRWRSTAFIAVDGTQTLFKATDYTIDSLLLDPGVFGLYDTVLDTGMQGDIVDGDVPLDARIVSLGIERDAFRNGLFAINASFLNSENESWAGIYLGGLDQPPLVGEVPLPMTLPLLACALGGLALLRRRG